MTFVWLYLIAMAGGGLSGICVAGGRNCHIHKRCYYLMSVVQGVLLVNLVLVGVSVLYGAMLTWMPFDALFASLEAAGEAALHIYGAYALVVAVTFAFYAVPNLEMRTFATVVLFGPLTLVRPLVILAGFAMALVQVPHWPVAALYGVAAAGMIAANRLLYFWLKRGKW